MERILSDVRGYDGLLELAPSPGSQHPEISWGDHFFYYAPDREVPTNRQPYATIVTKDYPDDTRSRLDGRDRWRLNIHVGTELFTELLGSTPKSFDASAIDFSATDTFMPHPLYGALGWVSVVNPGPATIDRALAALRAAHLADRRRDEARRGEARRDETRRARRDETGETRRDETGETRRDETGETRRDETRRDETGEAPARRAPAAPADTGPG